MSLITDIMAFQIVKILVTPFSETKAFKLGVIDANGNLKKDPKLFSVEEKESYSALYRIVFKLKKLLAKVPGGKSQIASLAAAYWLVKEGIEDENMLEDLIESEIIFAEEYLIMELALKEDGPAGGGTASGAGGLAMTQGNVTGRNVSTDQPVVRKKDKKKYFKLVRRGIPASRKFRITQPDNNPIIGTSAGTLGVST